MGRNENTNDGDHSRLRSRIRRILLESNTKMHDDQIPEDRLKKKQGHRVLTETSQSGNKRQLLTGGVRSGGLMVATSKRDEVVLRHRQHPSEPLFESYEDYVAYMISDDIDRPQYSTFVSMNEYNEMNGSRILYEDRVGGFGEERSRVFSDDEFEYDGFGSVDEYWRDSVEQILKEEKRREERSQESAKERQREWEERQRQREWEERQNESNRNRGHGNQQYTTSNPFGNSVQDRISRNKQRLLGEFGLPTTASLDDVKRAYRDQMKQWHPDKFASKGDKAQEDATKKTQTLNESYQKILRQDFM